MNFNKKHSLKKFFVDTLFYIAGSLIFGAGIYIFALPNQIPQGGVTGIAILLNHLFSFPVGIGTFIINLPLFIVAGVVLGLSLVSKSFYVLLIFSTILDFCVELFPAYHGDPLLAALFCGVLCGVGLSMILLRGSSTGGTDILAKIIHKFKPQYNISVLIAICNIFIVALSSIVYRSIESGMYSIIVIIVSSRVMDFVLCGVSQGHLLMIVTMNPAELSQEILRKIGRGVTVLPVTGAYTGNTQSILMVAIHRMDLVKIRKVIRRIDPESFTIIAKAGDVFGRGFTPTNDL